MRHQPSLPENRSRQRGVHASYELQMLRSTHTLVPGTVSRVGKLPRTFQKRTHAQFPPPPPTRIHGASRLASYTAYLLPNMETRHGWKTTDKRKKKSSQTVKQLPRLGKRRIPPSRQSLRLSHQTHLSVSPHTPLLRWQVTTYILKCREGKEVAIAIRPENPPGLPGTFKLVTYASFLKGRGTDTHVYATTQGYELLKSNKCQQRKEGPST